MSAGPISGPLRRAMPWADLCNRHHTCFTPHMLHAIVSPTMQPYSTALTAPSPPITSSLLILLHDLPTARSLSAPALQERVHRWPVVAGPGGGPCAWPERSSSDALPEHLAGLGPLLQQDFPTLIGHEAARQLAVGGILVCCAVGCAPARATCATS